MWGMMKINDQVIFAFPWCPEGSSTMVNNCRWPLCLMVRKRLQDGPVRRNDFFPMTTRPIYSPSIHVHTPEQKINNCLPWNLLSDSPFISDVTFLIFYDLHSYLQKILKHFAVIPLNTIRLGLCTYFHRPLCSCIDLYSHVQHAILRFTITDKKGLWI